MGPLIEERETRARKEEEDLQVETTNDDGVTKKKIHTESDSLFAIKKKN